MKSIVQVLLTFCIASSLYDAATASTTPITFSPGMGVDEIVDISGELTTRRQPFAVKILNSENKQEIALYLQGQRYQMLIRHGHSKVYHRDSNYIGPSKPFRIVIRKSSNGIKVYLLDERVRIQFQREITTSSQFTRVWAEGAYTNGNVVKTSWSDYLCLPENCGTRQTSVEVPDKLCNQVSEDNIHRIVGGSPAPAGDQPWQVSIWERKYEANDKVVWNHSCGGTLISECWVVSAAHCFTQEWDTPRWKVRVGDYNNENGRDKEFSAYEDLQSFNIKKIYKQPNYWSTAHTTVNDVALIQLEKDADGRCARFGPFVQPICLPKAVDQYVPGKECVITGWGATQHGQKLPEFAKCLQKARVNLISKEQCKEHYPDKAPEAAGLDPEEVILDSMQCTAKIGAAESDSCQGDSGGPLTCSNNQTSYIWGITSWGKGCGKNYGIYTRVASFMDFLEKRLVQECKYVP